MFVMGNWVFKLSFVDTFHGELDLSRRIFSREEFYTVGFATKSDDFVTFKLDFKETRGVVTRTRSGRAIRPVDRLDRY